MTTGDAIQKLRETENMLQKKQDFLEKKIEQELDTAKKNGTKNKRGKTPQRPCIVYVEMAQKKTSVRVDECSSNR